ncbi:MAG: protein translocase subunit SecD [candidate division KSB1 bacterium]|nr:protein translocase subunit SecD [candidate division KSB1 bacterium]
MQRKHVTRLIFIVALIILAVVSLYPTFQLGDLQEKESELFSELNAMTGLSQVQLTDALVTGELANLVRKNVSADSQEIALETADNLIELNQKIDKVSAKAIRQGLDLRGGTYLVYETDLPELLQDLAKNPDGRLEEIIQESRQAVESEGVDFFVALEQSFEKRDLAMNRYFGRKGETPDEIIRDLKLEAEDAIDRTLEVLRNRINQFGVSEPSITKQGDRRIEIQLAGIQNIQRAKRLIGQTALLEFRLVKEADMVWSILDDIDRVLRSQRAGKEILDDVETETDTTFEEGEVADESEVSLEELFGDQDTMSEEEDTTVVVDEKTFSEKPFTSLLRRLSGQANYIAVPAKNLNAVQRIIQLPEVQDVIPNDTEFVFGRWPINFNEQEFHKLYLLNKEPELLGKMLTDASVQISGGDASLTAGNPQVQMELNNEGAKIFARVTGMNVGRQLAVVLDGKVASAPNIDEKIPTGSAVIRGSFSMDEAKDLALVLRAGALPAPVYAITENTVGPSLGRDSVQRGQLSAVIGLALVVVFMVIYYRASGLVADFALLLNILFVFAVMAGFHATLTLPGIAGIILTVGMAVDANVLIFERIREELRGGKTVQAALDSGYGRAFTTILDANVTTLITAIVLYSFGTGPIQGFALTLSIGIVASMFTAIVVTRLVFELVLARYKIKTLSI